VLKLLLHLLLHQFLHLLLNFPPPSKFLLYLIINSNDIVLNNILILLAHTGQAPLFSRFLLNIHDALLFLLPFLLNCPFRSLLNFPLTFLFDVLLGDLLRNDFLLNNLLLNMILLLISSNNNLFKLA